MAAICARTLLRAEVQSLAVQVSSHHADQHLPGADVTPYVAVARAQRRALSSLVQRAHGPAYAERVRRPGWVSEVRRPFASDEKGEESHDDFKPKRKAPPADLDDAVKLVGEQVKTAL
jgi:hypothetical protein